MEKEIPEYTIGIVTYFARFEKYFKPLVEKINKIFPDVDVVVVLNGSYDQAIQIPYLDTALSFLSQFPNVRTVTHFDHQSLAKCWNEIMLLSHHENILILNDDTDISELARHEIEEVIGTHPLITLNKSWSHFLIQKDLVRKIGWFDERFVGIGHEDGDYAYRMAMAQIHIHNVMCDGLRNYVVQNDNPGFLAVSKPKGKYSLANEEFFNKKWINQYNSPEIKTFDYVSDFNNGETPFSLVLGMETPLYYPLNLLDTKISHKIKKTYRMPPVRRMLEVGARRTARKIIHAIRRLRK